MAKKPTTLMARILAPLGSFWLAVALLVNLFLLTWLGTLEQVEKGIHQVQEEYFESWIVFAKAAEGPRRVRQIKAAGRDTGVHAQTALVAARHFLVAG